jgi:hypothetical protein
MNLIGAGIPSLRKRGNSGMFNIDDGRIAGAVLGDESNLGNPKSGRIKGFDGVIE